VKLTLTTDDGVVLETWFVPACDAQELDTSVAPAEAFAQALSCAVWLPLYKTEQEYVEFRQGLIENP